ncbi:uncharacterized protein EDB91DRAFT_1254109 [Suillus paluster]|uniref:uncharacterized protein n=1 Tax=Suillus paluster TaxID=48578 RepID=UPI001B86B4DC|nr:uncharacterized protein EDB91DRAFT_1254109 [Suillus paluster]KAG1726866.1 hypothetical protein EDB91DRAFT_1254109 [Suillus paluster]
MTSTSTEGSSISTATIAGIIIGVVASAALAAGACFYLRCWRQGRGRFTRLRKGRRVIDADEEFVSHGSSVSVCDRRGGYGHGQHPSVSLEPLLLPSPPPTSQNIPVPPLPRDWSYLHSPVPPVLPNITTDPSILSLYEADDPYTRIERAILPTSAVHDMSVSSREALQEATAEQYSRHTAKFPGPSAPLFINRTLARPSVPDFSGRTSTSLFLPANLPHSISSRSGSTDINLFEQSSRAVSAGDAAPLKPQISFPSLPAEQTTRKQSEFQTRAVSSEVDASSPESIYSQESAQHASHPPDSQLSTQLSRRGKSFRRHSRALTLTGLSPVMEGSTSTNEFPSHDVSTNSEIEKKPSRTFSELEKQSSLSVALSHSASSTGPECTSFPLLSSNNAFGKSDSASSHGWTTSGSSGRTTRYPSLAPSSSGPSSSNSNPHPHSDSATEWHRPPAGLAALKHLELPNPHAASPQEILDASVLPPARQSLLAADKWLEVAPHKAHLRAHSPGSVPEVERRSIVQCGIASIDVTL